MVAIGAVLVVVSLSILATRIGSLAFEATGLSREAARFQARSAFTGVGFTTSEAESITSQPARRRIASILMLLGNAGIVSIIASLVLGFAEAAPRQALQRLGVLVAGLGLLLIVVRSERFAALLSRMLERRLARWADVDTRDYVRLLGISDDYAVRESMVESNGWLAGRELSDLDLPREGVLVLGVRRSDGTYLGAPAPGTTLRAGDHVLLYGHQERLTEVVHRPEGGEGQDRRDRAIAEHRHQRAQEAARDASTATGT